MKILKMLIEIELPDKDTPQYSKQDLLVDIAVLLYQKEIYSLAKCARFCGLNRIEFQKTLANKGVFLNFDIEDFEQDLKTLRKLKTE
jgi:predicted HTH domain antitoxin